MNNTHLPFSNRLLVNAVDERARDTPHAVFLRYAGPTWETDGYESITYSQSAEAVNKAAHWLDQQLADDADAQTVSYVGPNDARYFFITTGAIKTGRRVLITDGRIGGDGIITLLNHTETRVWITTEDERHTAEGLQAKLPGLKILIVPSLEYFLQPDATPPYPYSKTWADAKDDIVFIIHSSGTTGRPKPIYHTNRFISTMDSWHVLYKKYSPRSFNIDVASGICTLYAALPQWAAGMISYFCCVFNNRSMAILPAGVHLPLDIQVVIKILEKNPAIKALVSPPRLVEEMFVDDRGLQILNSLSHVTVSGAPLDETIGNALRQSANLVSAMGSTEGGGQLSFQCSDPASWNSFDFIPETGARFEQVADDLFELFIDRRPDGELVQGILDVMDADTNSISMKELYSPRQYADGSTRWVFRGRTDDLIKLKWLAKFHASDIENAVRQHPFVENVFIGGEARTAPFVIIQLHDRMERSLDEQTQLLDELYDRAISAKNAQDSTEIRIPKGMVMLADPKKPFPVTLKGTLARKAVEDLYHEEIEAMYRALEAN